MLNGSIKVTFFQRNLLAVNEKKILKIFLKTQKHPRGDKIIRSAGQN